MGTGIGQIAAQQGCHVVYFDNYPGAIGRSSASIEKVFGRLVEKGRMSEAEKTETLSRMNWSDDLSSIDGADLVVEAVIEDLKVKKELLQKAEQHLSDTAWLCTNTSSLSIAALSSGLKHPERFGGLHFFNPAP